MIPGAKDASDKSLQETEKKAASTHRMTKAQQNNSPSLYGRPGSTNHEQYSKKIELLSSGILVSFAFTKFLPDLIIIKLPLECVIPILNPWQPRLLLKDFGPIGVVGR